jgi:hypothetical protein
VEINQGNPLVGRDDEPVLNPPGRSFRSGILTGVIENVVPERDGGQGHGLTRDDGAGAGESPGVRSVPALIIVTLLAGAPSREAAS